jgi:TRAP-type C4-dicarboxylate transport system substrate-binding protein
MFTRRHLVGGALAAPAVFAAGRASAQEMVLRAVSVFQEGTAFSRPFEAFMQKVNEEGRGLVRINFIGGPRAMPPFEIGNAIRNGVVDMANTSAAFYANLLPAGGAIRLSTRPWAEIRQNGGWALINRLHNERLNAWYLARHGSEIPFHLYTTREISGPDLRGWTIRTTPTYSAFFTALGANLVTTPPGEVYTALERGVVQGYGWPAVGIFDLGWHERTRFRVDPGFYSVDVSIQINLRRWQAMRDEQRAFLTEVAAWLEAGESERARREIAAEFARMEQAGIRVITFQGADRERWLNTAAEAGWAEIFQQAPEHAAELRRLLAA